MENITFGVLKRYLLAESCYSMDEMKHYDAFVRDIIYTRFFLPMDRGFGNIFGTHISHFKITFTDDEKSFVEVFNCKDGSKPIVRDLMENMENIPIKRYISVSPVKSARN